MKDLSVDDLRCVIFDPRGVPGRGLSDFNAAFSLWDKVWSQTLLELDGLPRVHSDDFSRQHEISCIFYGKKCVALIFARHVDFRSMVTAKDSYFQYWSEREIAQLTQFSPLIQVGSNITVDPDYRGRLKGGVHLKSIVLHLAVKSLILSNCSAMTGVMRADRGMEKLAYDLGATSLAKNVPAHGVDTDLVAWYRTRVSEPGVVPKDILVERLWALREDFCLSRSRVA